MEISPCSAGSFVFAAAAALAPEQDATDPRS